jgi:hypothetical protein
MGWTAPRTWVTGELVTAAQLNEQIKDNEVELRAGGTAIASQATGDVITATSSTQLGRVAPGTSGNVLTSNGSVWASSTPAAVTYVAFPATQVASGDVNTLDDYEEGDWTPVLGGAGGTSGQAYADFRDGRYVKIGKVVTITFSFKMTTEGTITGDCQIQQLPFTARTVDTGGAEVTANSVDWNGTTTSYVGMSAVVKSATTVAAVVGLTAAATGFTNLAAANVQANTTLTGMLVYEASA